MERSDEEHKWHQKGYKKGKADYERIVDDLFKQIKGKDENKMARSRTEPRKSNLRCTS